MNIDILYLWKLIGPRGSSVGRHSPTPVLSNRCLPLFESHFWQISLPNFAGYPHLDQWNVQNQGASQDAPRTADTRGGDGEWLKRQMNGKKSFLKSFLPCGYHVPICTYMVCQWSSPREPCKSWTPPAQKNKQEGEQRHRGKKNL